MVDVCSCGARLAEDALFCHRCGKPQRELPVPENQAMPAEVEAVLEQAATVERPQDISFSNGAAVRVAAVVAGLAMVVLIPLANLGGMSLIGILLPTLLSGVLSVVLYQRRTGTDLTVLAGARMGWITGVFIFALFLILFTISAIPAIEGGEFQKVQEAALKSNFSEADFARVKAVLENPVTLTLSILIFMVIYFVGATTLSSLGGMLGAKLLGRNESL